MSIRQNLLDLRAKLAAEPSRMIDLENFQAPHVCGTIHCALGLAGTMPKFAAMGLHYDPHISPGYLKMRLGVDAAMGHAGLDLIFGSRACDQLFACRHEGLWDEDILDKAGDGVNDQDLALARIDKQLENYP